MALASASVVVPVCSCPLSGMTFLHLGKVTAATPEVKSPHVHRPPTLVTVPLDDVPSKTAMPQSRRYGSTNSGKALGSGIRAQLPRCQRDPDARFGCCPSGRSHGFGLRNRPLPSCAA